MPRHTVAMNATESGDQTKFNQLEFKNEIKQEISNVIVKFDEQYEGIKTILSGIQNQLTNLQEKHLELEEKYILSDHLRTSDILLETHPDQIIPLVNNKQTFNENIVSNSHNMFKLKDLVPKFNGKDGNAVQFLKSLNDVVGDKNNFTNNMSNIIRSSLIDDAQVWYSIIEGSFTSFGEFEELFLNKFWGEIEQSKTRNNLYTGKFRPDGILSRESYFTRKYAILQFLTPKIQENEIIRHMARHFDFEITKCVVTQDIKKFSAFCELLKQYDDLYRNRFTNVKSGDNHRNSRPDNRSRGNFQGQTPGVNTHPSHYRQDMLPNHNYSNNRNAYNQNLPANNVPQHNFNQFRNQNHSYRNTRSNRYTTPTPVNRPYVQGRTFGNTAENRNVSNHTVSDRSQRRHELNALQMTDSPQNENIVPEHFL
jgi:hypothetical protein